MYKSFIGYAKEPEKTETKYIIEYIADNKHGINFVMRLKIIV